MQIKNIYYEMIDEKDSVYDFSVDIQIQKEGTESSINQIVNGQANLNDEHKIEAMVIHLEDLYKSKIINGNF